jgi:hypothetical protein
LSWELGSVSGRTERKAVCCMDGNKFLFLILRYFII